MSKKAKKGPKVCSFGYPPPVWLVVFLSELGNVRSVVRHEALQDRGHGQSLHCLLRELGKFFSRRMVDFGLLPWDLDAGVGCPPLPKYFLVSLLEELVENVENVTLQNIDTKLLKEVKNFICAVRRVQIHYEQRFSRRILRFVRKL